MNKILKNVLYIFLIPILAACNNEADIAQQDDEQPVRLSLDNTSVGVYQTRGTGTVGGTTTATNVWNSENVYVLMTTVPGKSQSTWTYSVFKRFGEQFNGTFYCRPEQVGNKWYLDYESYNGHQKKYYPTDGTRSDFFAFYIDDAADSKVANHPQIDTDVSKEIKAVRFTIDGTQDILAGKAEKSAADSLIDSERGYSAKTSRLGIIPNIKIEHLLTRFTFGILPGHTNANGMIVKSISLESKDKGKLVVAYNDARTYDAKQLIEWTNSKSRFVLHEAGNSSSSAGKPQLQPLTPLTIQASGAAVGKETLVGEAMFVNPNETSYMLYITYLFPMGEGQETFEMTAELPVKMQDGSMFKQGSSYHVSITVNGLSDIVLNATLEKWKEGGSVDISTDEYFYPSYKR